MKVVILAGGDQTRFGPFEKQPKVLYPLPSGKNLLDYTVSELEDCPIDNITVSVSNKKLLTQYVRDRFQNRRLRIEPLESEPMPLGRIAYKFLHLTPVTFLFGDTFFPTGSLRHYFETCETLLDCAASIGVSPVHVGDYQITAEAGLVKNITSNPGGLPSTCGIFSILNCTAVEHLAATEKMTDLFSQMVKSGLKVRAIDLPPGIVDLDTQDKTTLLH